MENRTRKVSEGRPRVSLVTWRRGKPVTWTDLRPKDRNGIPVVGSLRVHYKGEPIKS